MLIRLSLALIVAVGGAACRHATPVPDKIENVASAAVANSPNLYQFDGNNPPETPNEPIEEYPGKTIDQIFPISVEHDFSRGEGDRGKYTILEAGYEIDVLGFAPVSVSRNRRNLLTLRTRAAKEDYHSFLVGRSKLLGEDSDQIYIVSLGPGGVCCTNYWIVDISTNRPKLIFRSEQYGYFRDPMEIFDADGDGIFELMQWDSCMRYFLDDCGACSPEPRAYFKFDSRSLQYLPARKTLQDFVRKSIAETEKSLEEQYQKIRDTGDRSGVFDLKRSALNHSADLLHWGMEKHAWAIFEKYNGDPTQKKELLNRLRSCAFYQTLKKLK